MSFALRLRRRDALRRTASRRVAHAPIAVQRTGAAELVAVVDLAPGKYEYKFVVDGEWRCCTLQTITKDNLGNENNCMEVRARALMDDGDTDG